MCQKSDHVLKSLVAWLCLAATAYADPLAYEPARDPGVGFNLISWWDFGANGAEIWRDAVRDVYANGFRHVSLCPVRTFNPNTGAIDASPANLPPLSQIAAAAEEARRLGMTVTVNPFIEPEGFEFWRGEWDPPRAVRERFWVDYQSYLIDVAHLAENAQADRMLVGTELRAITRNLAHNAPFGEAISAAGDIFQGQIGYAANFDEYDGANITSAIWEHPDVDFIGVDAYYNLASEAQADASGAHPNDAFIDVIRNRWNELLDEEILPFAAERKGGAGMEVVFTEHGLIPFNRTTVTPWNYLNGENAVDQDEQLNGYQALIEALDGRRDRLGEVYLWQWGMPGAAGSYWYLNPDGVDVPGNGYDESLGAPAARFLAAYAQTGLRLPGDTNGDGQVDLADLNNVRNHFGESGEAIPGDANGDGTVDLADLNDVRNHFGATNSVPEPSSFALLGCLILTALVCAVGSKALGWPQTPSAETPRRRLPWAPRGTNASAPVGSA